MEEFSRQESFSTEENTNKSMSAYQVLRNKLFGQGDILSLAAIGPYTIIHLKSVLKINKIK